MTIIGMSRVSVLTGTEVSDAYPWIGIMFIGSIVIWIAKGGSAVLLAEVAANVVMAVRQDLYEAIVRKDIGWHDHRVNSSGVLTSTLASDV